MVIFIFLFLTLPKSTTTSTGIATKVPYEKVVKGARKVPPIQISHQSLNPPKNYSLNLSQESNPQPLYSQKVTKVSYDISNTLKKVSTLYVEHDPITIWGNEDFSTTAALENWPGNGTESNPYKINGLNITGPSDRILIGIINTDAFFQISNCILSEGFYGINFHDVTNGVISNNTIVNNHGGILLETSGCSRISNNHVSKNQGRWSGEDWDWGSGVMILNSNYSLISNNTISNNERHGILLYESAHSNLSSNVVFNNSMVPWYSGIHLEGSENCTLSNNIISDNRFQGIYFGDSGNSTISGNHISNHEESGIYLSESGNNRILNNIMLNNGVHIESWEFNTLQKNLLQSEVANNTVNGKELIYWQNITGGTISSEAGQILVVNCTGITISNQSLSNVTTGIQIIYSLESLIKNNTVFNNSKTGISLRFSQNCTIINNHLFNNEERGLLLEWSADCNISDNIITNTQSGIKLWFSRNSSLSGNTLANINGTGIDLEMSENCSIYNSCVSGSLNVGIVVDASENCSIYNSCVSGSLHRGIFLYYSSNCVIMENTIIWKRPMEKTIIYQNVRDAGVYLGASSNTTVTNNTVRNCVNGIFLSQCHDNSIFHNKVFENTYVGIRLENSRNNFITSNVAYNNSEHGFWLYESNDNILSGNVGSNNTFCGIKLVDNSDFNELYNNTALNNNEDGFWIHDSFRNTVINNTSNYNYFSGIHLTISDNNIITNNFFINNIHYGIAIEVFSEYNDVKWNDFIKNNPIGHSQAFDAGSNNTFSLNYWEEWTSPDANTNGIVDLPYSIDGDINATDSYPLVFSNQPPIEIIGLMIAFPNGGETLNRTVPIRWKPAIDSREDSFSYSFFYSSDGGITWILFVETPEIPTDEYDIEFQFDWNTTDVDDGSNYMIRVIAENFQGSHIEDTSDGTFTIDNHPPPIPLEIRVVLFFLVVSILVVAIRTTLKQRK